MNNLEHTAEVVKSLLLSSPGLGTLSLVSHNVVTPFQFQDGFINTNEQLPAVKEVTLTEYRWIHSGRTASHFWNFSKVVKLVLTNVKMSQFIRAVEAERTLQLPSFAAPGSRFLSDSNIIHNFVSGMHAPRKLLLRSTALDPTFSLAICKYGETLQTF